VAADNVAKRTIQYQIEVAQRQWLSFSLYSQTSHNSIKSVSRRKDFCISILHGKKKEQNS